MNLPGKKTKTINKGVQYKWIGEEQVALEMGVSLRLFHIIVLTSSLHIFETEKDSQIQDQ